MLLKFKFTGKDADKISFLIYKNPGSFYERGLNGHMIYLFYKKYEKDTVLFDFFMKVNSESIRKNNIYGIFDYVNDRPYALSSITSSGIKKCFMSAMRGDEPKGYEYLVSNKFKFELEAVCFTNSNNLSIKLFEGLGYSVKRNDLKDSFAYSLTIKGESTVKDLLNQLYILIPVIDNHKYFYCDESEVDKIIRFGGDWLKNHPLYSVILKRYLKYKDSLIKKVDDVFNYKDEDKEDQEEIAAKRDSLGEKRYDTISRILKSYKSKKVIDFGCGSGKLTLKIADHVDKVLSVDSYYQALERLKYKIKKNNNIKIKFGNIYYYDDEYDDYDSVVMCEVIEHLNHYKVAVDNVFKNINPNLVIITTPNKNYNYHYGMSSDQKRHRDHKFEWTTKEFKNIMNNIASKYQYRVHYVGVGNQDEDGEHATVISVFNKLN